MMQSYFKNFVVPEIAGQRLLLTKADGKATLLAKIIFYFTKAHLCTHKILVISVFLNIKIVFMKTKTIIKKKFRSYAIYIYYFKYKIDHQVPK